WHRMPPVLRLARSLSSMEAFLQVASINSCAIVVDPADNVAVVKTPLASGALVEIADGLHVRVTGGITPGNRFATKSIPAGGLVLQYGQPIGTSRGIGEGDPVSPANMSNEVPLRRDLPPDLHNGPPRYLQKSDIATFMGFRRPDGRVGTRNFVLI